MEVPIKDRIIHVLSIFPKISPTMLQMGIGPHLKANLWQPVLEQLVMENIVVREHVTLQSAGGRWKTYTMISLREPADLSRLAVPLSQIVSEDEEEDEDILTTHSV